MYKNYEQDKKLIKYSPSPRQLDVMEMEFYAFAHFGINTFTERQWGDGKENPQDFNPTEFNANQWVDALKSAEIKGLILTCKHHDGFCLWPSKYTKHSILSSPYKNGNGDIVKEVAEACKKGGIKFGVYLSPWDRNSALYGDSDKYNDYFCNQITELCSNYGELFTFWFDGACGEGPNGKKQVYDWERYYKIIRELQPNACISICGPDIRWCGNEAGDTRESEWSVIPTKFNEPDYTANLSQKEDDKKFISKKIVETNQDLGSRSFVEDAADFKWFPAEVDTSIRPNWFYTKEDDNKVRSLSELMNIYYRSVGGNCTLLLNIPPDKRGIFHENDVARLKEMGESIRKAFAVNLMDKATLHSTEDDGINLIENVISDDYDTFFKTADGTNHVSISLIFQEATTVSKLVLKENVLQSQRIERFSIRAKIGESYKDVYTATTVGYKHIACFNEMNVKELRIDIHDSRVSPTLSFIGIY